MLTTLVYRLLSILLLLLLWPLAAEVMPAGSPSWTGLSRIVLLFLLFRSIAGLLNTALKLITERPSRVVSARPMTGAMTRLKGSEASEPLAQTARHEAAHAVAAVALGHKLTSVSTEWGLSDNSLGRCAWVHPDAPSIDLVIVALAGNVSQEIPTHYDVGSFQDDYQSALRASLVVAIYTGASPSSVLDEALSRAREIVANQSIEIERLTAALAAQPITIGGADALRIIRGEQP